MDTRTILIALHFAGLALAAAPGWGASFDCSGNITSVEKLICSVGELSELDETLAKAYRDRRADSKTNKAITRDQVKWLSTRNACHDLECIKGAYEKRLAELQRPTAGSGPDPFTIVARLEDYRPTDYPILAFDGKLIFSQYDKSGNNFDILSLDIEDQSSRYLLRGRSGARFIGQNEKYLVVSEKGRNANPLVVIDRATGERVKQIRLSHEITWARIFDGRLIVIQGGSFGGGYSAKATAVTFALPGLKLIKSTEIIGGNDADVWKGKLLSLGYDLAIYDTDLNEIARIKLPERRTGTGVSCASTTPLRIYDDHAVIVTNCGDILIYNLTSLKLERTIPGYSHFYAVAVMDGLVLTAPIGEPRQLDNAHVYELSSGREVAVLPINATDLFVKGNRLLAVERQFVKPTSMTLYSLDSATLKNGEWQIARVVAACKKARKEMNESGDLYAAIDLCKGSGIEGLISRSELPSDIVPLVRDYALWLSQTLDLFPEAITLLETLSARSTDPVVTSALAEARLKSTILETKAIGLLTSEEKSTRFGHVLALDPIKLKMQAKTVEFGAFSNLFHFSGDRIYVGRYGCRTTSCQESGASVSIPRLSRGL